MQALQKQRCDEPDEVQGPVVNERDKESAEDDLYYDERFRLLLKHFRRFDPPHEMNQEAVGFRRDLQAILDWAIELYGPRSLMFFISDSIKHKMLFTRDTNREEPDIDTMAEMDRWGFTLNTLGQGSRTVSLTDPVVEEFVEKRKADNEAAAKFRKAIFSEKPKTKIEKRKSKNEK